MAEQDHRLVDRLDDRSHVLGLPFQGVLVGVAALAAPTTVHRVDRAVFREGGTDRLPPRVVGGRSVDEHEWWPDPRSFVYNRRPVG